MTEILTWMGEHPFLTFFLAYIFFQSLVYIARYIAYAIRGNPGAVKDKSDRL